MASRGIDTLPPRSFVITDDDIRVADGRGCLGVNTCGDKHRCDAMKADGKVCGEPHARTRHDRRDATQRQGQLAQAGICC